MDQVAKSAVPLLLHTVWKDDSGFHLQVERPEGHRIITDVDLLEVPAHQRRLFAILDRGSRAQLTLKLRTSKGRAIEKAVPTWIFPPWATVTVLVQLQEEASSEAMTLDLRFFIDVVQELGAFACSGRALMGLTWEDNK